MDVDGSVMLSLTVNPMLNIKAASYYLYLLHLLLTLTLTQLKHQHYFLFLPSVFQAAHYVMGIVHGEASYLPDFLDYFSANFPSTAVKMEILGKKDIETTTMANFYSQVRLTHTHTLTHTGET